MVEETSNSVVPVEPSGADFSSVDAITRARIGSLSAHGVPDLQIADILFLTSEQVVACKFSEEFKKKYAEVAEDQIQKQIDLAEGWDAVETKGLEQVLTTLDYNRDPKFALAAATMANKALRRKNQAGNAPVIDASQTGRNNIIVLNINKNYVQNVGESKTINLIERTRTQQKISDLPSPKHIDQVLAPVRIEKIKELSPLEEEWKRAGVVFDTDINE